MTASRTRFQQSEPGVADRLPHGGWRAGVREKLDELLGGGEQGVIVFDFDHTLVSDDLGDATLATLMAGPLSTSSIARTLSPPLTVEDALLQFDEDPFRYYDGVQRATSHDATDDAPCAAAYLWAVQIMAGLSPADIVAATARAWQAAPLAPLTLHNEMVDLLGMLTRAGHRVLIVSATNVWSVRWAVRNVLNPALTSRFGMGVQVDLRDVAGIGMVLRHRDSGRCEKDRHLLDVDDGYVDLCPKSLEQYELTPHFDLPVSTYSGKVERLRTLIDDETPVLCVGDSDNDLELLQAAKQQLWVARLDQSALQEKAAERSRDYASWLVQPVVPANPTRFVSRAADILELSPAIERSMACWRNRGLLAEF